MNQPIPGDNAYIANAVPSNWQKTPCGNIPPHFETNVVIMGSDSVLLMGSDNEIITGA